MSAIVIKLGSKNDLVGDWQSFLRGEEVYLGAIDDDFGQKTHESTIKFQLKGKISVAGNARTRTVFHNVGFTSHTTFNNKILLLCLLKQK